MTEMVPLVSPHSAQEIMNIADRNLSKFFPIPISLIEPQALYHLFEFGELSKIGFSYGVEELPHREEAHTDFKTNTIVLSIGTYDRLAKDEHRARFTLAHEIGHAVMHANSMHALRRPSAARQEACGGVQSPIKKFRRGQFPAYLDPEWQANKFASYFLMPNFLLDQIAKKGNLTIQALSMSAHVSALAAQYRIEEYSKSRRKNSLRDL